MNLRIDHSLEDDGGSEATMSIEEQGERRQFARNLRVMRVARLAAPDIDAEGLGMVRDVSPGGMMIDAHFDLAIGQSVSIALIDDQELTGTVAWKEGRMLGICFAEEIPVDRILAKPAAQADGKRARLPRFSVQKSVQIKLDTVTLDAILHDVSQRGGKLQCEGKLRVHSNLLLRAEGTRPVGATIKWRAGDMLGVEFHRLLAIDELEHWLKA
jgi:PilZ domain